jgi:glycosyltransferase involved in cell wall biosynthesis
VGDIDGFSNATLDLLNNPKKSEQLVKKAQKFIPRYDWKNIARTEFKS